MAFAPAVFFRRSSLHDAEVEAAHAQLPVEARLQAFLRRLQWLHARRTAAAWALHAGLLTFAPALLLAWCLEPHRILVVASWLLLLAVTAVLGLLGSFAHAARRGVAGMAPHQWLHGLPDAPMGTADELSTWCELQPSSARPMLHWLALDLDDRLTSLTPPQWRGVARPRAPRSRSVFLAVLLLAILLLLAWWFDPPWLGPKQPEPPLPPPLPPAALPKVAGAAAPPTIPAPGQREQGGAPPPPPLLLLPEKQHFVVPRFASDGPSRKERVRVAELPQPAAGGVAPPPTAAAEPLPRIPAPETFERAAEAAQRSRHVGPEEQAMVRRFFTLLQQAAK